MFLKQEKPEMEDFEKDETLVIKKKYLEKFQYFNKILEKFPSLKKN